MAQAYIILALRGYHRRIEFEASLDYILNSKPIKDDLNPKGKYGVGQMTQRKDPHGGLQLPVTPAPGDSMAPSGPYRLLYVHGIHTHTHTHTHTHGRTRGREHAHRRDVSTNVHFSIIHNSQQVEMLQISTNQ